MDMHEIRCKIVLERQSIDVKVKLASFTLIVHIIFSFEHRRLSLFC